MKALLAFLLGTTAAAAGKLPLMGVGGGGGGGGPPAWVSSICPTYVAGGACIDFVGNQAYVSTDGTISTPSQLLSVTASGGRSYYDPAQIGTSGLYTTVSNNTLALGAQGLQ